MSDQQNPQNPSGGIPSGSASTPPPSQPIQPKPPTSPSTPPQPTASPRSTPPNLQPSNQPPAPVGIPPPAYPPSGMPPQGIPGGTSGTAETAGAPWAPGANQTQPSQPIQPKPPSPPANFQLGAFLPKELKIPVPKHSLTFNEDQFLRLLAGSISLTKDEKIRIIDSIPKLKQTQVDELIRIFEEEKRKFAELGQEHVPQLERLAKQHYEDWVDIEMHYSQQAKKGEESKQAEELRKKLGLN